MGTPKSTNVGLLKRDADRKKSPEKRKAEKAMGDAFLTTIQFLMDKLIGLYVLSAMETKKLMILRGAMVDLVDEARIERVREEGYQTLINIICASMLSVGVSKENINELRGVFNLSIEALNENEQEWHKRETIELLG